jgi:hypothetical protein
VDREDTERALFGNLMKILKLKRYYLSALLVPRNSREYKEK